jgi:hypothetical protein
MESLKSRTVRDRMWILQKRKQDATAALKGVLQQIEKEERDLKKRCPHESVRYHTDIYEPSTYSCTACGKDVEPTDKTKIL